MPTPDLHVELSEVAAAQLCDLVPAMRLLKDEAQARRDTHLLDCLTACVLAAPTPSPDPNPDPTPNPDPDPDPDPNPNPSQARRAIEEVLVADPRSVHWRQQRATEEFGFCIDTLNVVCTFAAGTATVTKVHHLHLADRMSSHMSSGSGSGAPQEAAPVSGP